VSTPLLPTLPPSSAERRASRRFRAMHAAGQLQSTAHEQCPRHAMGNGRPCPLAPGGESRKDATPRLGGPDTGVARRVLRPNPRRALLTACMNANSLVTRGRGHQSHGRRVGGRKVSVPMRAITSNPWSSGPRVMAPTATSFDSHVAVVDS